ncbi:M48 family metallopeptidase [Winogradskyella sp. F6397]|uniref:M48 family metallopeptidase n=1 Tax=Winogradskyella marina TaxID=2785530 RepID=A0ABS0ELG4_9FLAO|nr:SprT family zinc-dependent metalloprotease [Winogradskyella marina]MBF8151309.1 M48 family metallopeptidase [Winogradskyella marina]
MKDKIQYGNTLIDYSLEFSERKTLGIKVHPDKSVKVSAPKESSIEKVREKVKHKASWIIKQQDFFLSFHPLTPERKFISGETHLYLGRQYRLKLYKSNEAYVKLKGGYINVYVKDKDDKLAVQEQLKKWYREKAEKYFEVLFKRLKSISKSFYRDEPTLSYRWMKKRWGSCDKNGNIHLNFELIKAPKQCIEYVIIHELCHLKYLNHSTDFFNLLEKVYPDWKIIKDRLEKMMV